MFKTQISMTSDNKAERSEKRIETSDENKKQISLKE